MSIALGMAAMVYSAVFSNIREGSNDIFYLGEHVFRFFTHSVQFS